MAKHKSSASYRSNDVHCEEAHANSKQMEDKRENGEGDDGDEPTGYSDSHRVYFFSILFWLGLSPIISTLATTSVFITTTMQKCFQVKNIQLGCPKPVPLLVLRTGWLQLLCFGVGSPRIKHRVKWGRWQAKFRAFGLRIGYVGHYCWAFLFFPVTRASTILPLVGLTSESSIKYHIWLGHISNFLFLVHTVVFLIYWAMINKLMETFAWNPTYVPNLAGTIAMVIGIAMWVTSLPYYRRKKFEIFFYTHHLYGPYVIFYVIHVGDSWLCMILPNIFLFFIDRYLRFLQSTKRSRLVSARILPSDNLELTFAKTPGLHYTPTSILFLYVPSISKLQWHPFTITSSSNLEKDTLSVVIRRQGSWTQKLYTHISSSIDSLEVSTEGPYGPNSIDLRHDSLILVSGGSGITPFISVIRELIFQSQSQSPKLPDVLLSLLLGPFVLPRDKSLNDSATSRVDFRAFAWNPTYVPNLAGTIAMVIGIAMWVTSLPYYRRKKFEIFFYTHHLYGLYIIFYVIHVGDSWLCMILPNIFLFFIDRYLRLVSAQILPSDNLELTFAKIPGLHYTPTSILFLHVPSISKLRWHPFTITSSSNLEKDTLSVVIRRQGSWTKKLYTHISSSIDSLEVSTEGPYGPNSIDLRHEHDSLILVSGGSGITPFISVIRELIFQSQSQSPKLPDVLLVCAFKHYHDLALNLRIEAYITQEDKKPETDNDHRFLQKKWFKPHPLDSPISPVLGPNNLLWLGVVILSSFVMFLLLIAIVTRYYIYPVDHNTGSIYNFSYRGLWDMFLGCVCIFIASSIVFLWRKKQNKEGEKESKKQVQSVDIQTPTSSPGSWFCGHERELESVPYQSIVHATSVHFGSKPNLKKILFEAEGSEDVGVMVCGPRKMRHEVARICSSGLAKNLHFEAISFNW
ncbi:LOW QUALITY PROTEIN: hypothetical protein HID58_023325 [Brassica napus]|uniref:FAD-binding FR-type domain-containing protein n=1 Tax=Brassica napus TaxID=3708 RepID=A0ABQ8D1S7_BRANA|nr:LOW QUALITY PROTEIN: hypothetical protein HID58_023325 [Brassica napus]